MIQQPIGNCRWKPDSSHHFLLATNYRWNLTAGTTSYWQLTVDVNLTVGTTSYWQLTVYVNLTAGTASYWQLSMETGQLAPLPIGN